MAVFVAAGQPGAGGRGREAGMDAARCAGARSDAGARRWSAEMRLRRAGRTREAESKANALPRSCRDLGAGRSGLVANVVVS
ncbi:hypothetical protein ABE196_18785 [Bacillus subtilis]